MHISGVESGRFGRLIKNVQTPWLPWRKDDWKPTNIKIQWKNSVVQIKVTAQWVLLLDQIENEAFKHSSEHSSSLIFVFELALKKKKPFWKECTELPSDNSGIAGRKEKISCSVLKKKELHIDQWV